jgi:tetratricopeptide (TPR) repeat protein
MDTNTMRRVRSIHIALVAALLMAASLPAFCATADPKGDPEAFFNWADEVIDDYNASARAPSISDILATIETAIAAHPTSAKLYLAKWRSLIAAECDEGNPRCASHDRSTILQKAADLDPDNARVQAAFVLEHLRHQCIKCAFPHLQEAKRIDTRSPHVLEADARLHEASGDTETAIALYLRSIEAFATPREKWSRYVKLSLMYSQNGDSRQRGWALEKALEARPDGALSYGNVAGYALEQGDFNRAIPMYRKALDKMRYGMAVHGLSMALWERWGDAYLTRTPAATQKAYLDEAMAMQPDKVAAFLASTSFKGTGRAAMALLASKQVPKAVLEIRSSKDLTPLLRAAITDNGALALYLVDAGANINAQDDTGTSAVYYAALHANRPLFDALVAKRADFRGTEGEMLMAASLDKDSPEDRVAIAKILLARGASLEAVGRDGRTALAMAAEEGSPEMVQFLLSQGARADHPNAQGMNPPALALISRNLPAFKVFIERRAGLDSKVLGRYSLAEFAEMNSLKEIADMIRAAEKH